MSQIQIILPEDTTKKLKILATKADRSLKKFIPLYLNQAVDLNLIDIDERTGTFISLSPTTATTITLEQLKEAGVKDFKFNKPDTPPTPDEQLLTQQKLDIEKQKIRKKRIEFLKTQCMNILGYTLPYLEKNNQKTIDIVLDKYPTNEDIIAYVNKLKEDEDIDTEEEYDYQTEIQQLEDLLSHPLSEEYQKIKYYCIEHDCTYELYQLLLYPSSIQIENYDHIIKKALGTPADYNYIPEELSLLASYFTKQ